MKARVITSIVGLALLVLVSTLFYTVFFNLIFAVLALIGIHEVYCAFGFGKKQVVFFISFIPVTLLIMLRDYAVIAKYTKPIGLIFVIFVAIYTILNIDRNDFAKIAATILFSAIVILCFYSLVRLKAIFTFESYSYDAMFFLVIILSYAWGADTLAFFAGRAFGKRKLAPKVSPKKTIAGAVGGTLGSILVSTIFTIIYVNIIGKNVVALQGATDISVYLKVAVIAIPASLLGIMGDLFASTIKRQHALKDYGKIFPGHGGILDRFDSVLFIAPFVVLVAQYLF